RDLEAAPPAHAIDLHRGYDRVAGPGTGPAVDQTWSDLRGLTATPSLAGRRSGGARREGHDVLTLLGAPMAASIYRSPAGETELRALYQEARAALGSACESHFVPTRYGATHVLVTGPASGPPAVVFHGGNFVGPYSLAWVLPALAGYRVYAPDTVGHPGLSAQTRLSPRDQSYGKWATAVLDGLGLDHVSVIGTSYGAAILLRL